jgi:hypothetical protein
VQAGLETIEYSIDSSERFVSARLASQRNGLLRLDVTFTVITAAISLGSFVTGLFGMNLGSGAREARTRHGPSDRDGGCERARDAHADVTPAPCASARPSHPPLAPVRVCVCVCVCVRM